MGVPREAETDEGFRRASRGGRSCELIHRKEVSSLGSTCEGLTRLLSSLSASTGVVGRNSFKFSPGLNEVALYAVVLQRVPLKSDGVRVEKIAICA